MCVYIVKVVPWTIGNMIGEWTVLRIRMLAAGRPEHRDSLRPETVRRLISLPTSREEELFVCVLLECRLRRLSAACSRG